jgi:hypothetical protein
MTYRDVCRPGTPAGGRVREDDVHLLPGETAEQHNAGGPSPGIQRFISQGVHGGPPNNNPPKPPGFPTGVVVDTWPGRRHADVHYEGRAADIYFNYDDARQRGYGDWLFNYCVANCVQFGVQGVIFGPRQWFSEVRGGQVFLGLTGNTTIMFTWS